MNEDKAKKDAQDDMFYSDAWAARAGWIIFWAVIFSGLGYRLFGKLEDKENGKPEYY